MCRDAVFSMIKLSLILVMLHMAEVTQSSVQLIDPVAVPSGGWNLCPYHHLLKSDTPSYHKMLADFIDCSNFAK